MNIVGSSILFVSLMLQTSLGSSGVFGKLENSLRVATQRKLPKTTRVAFENAPYQSLASKKPTASVYKVAANEALIYDVSSGQLLVEKNSTASVAMASLTKLMTTLVILQNHTNLDEIVTIPKDLPELGPADQKIGILPGEKFYLKDLLKATLIYSANDAANSLAIWDSGSVDKFADKMNSQANVWALNDSNFVNPTGLDAKNHLSSAQDLLVLSSILVQSPKVSEIVNTEKVTITSLAGKAYTLTTTNHDLPMPNVYGIKTGQTDNAGQCLILLGRNKEGHEIITVVLNSPDRFLESQNMVNYAFNNYIWK